jgi:hypothetical protein
MGYKEKFTKEEWRTLEFSVLWIFHAIAEVDGVISEEEYQSLFDAFAGEFNLQNALLNELLQSLYKKKKSLLEEFKADKLGIPMGLKAAAELVETKLDKEKATRFKRSLLFMGVVFAKAANEIPGESSRSKVDEAERAAILTVAAILRLSLGDMIT